MVVRYRPEGNKLPTHCHSLRQVGVHGHTVVIIMCPQHRGVGTISRGGGRGGRCIANHRDIETQEDLPRLPLAYVARSLEVTPEPIMILREPLCVCMCVQLQQQVVIRRITLV
jgi:hypothetical protein